MTDGSEAFEAKRVQLVQGLTNVAEAMRVCATIAEQYAQLLKDSPEKPTTSGKRKAKALDGDGEGTTRKRRVKKPRDPNEPKRPASSYIMFQNDVRKELKSQFPEMAQSELLHMIAKQWAEMTEGQKAVYSQANASAKERYSAEKAAYIATKKSADQAVLPAPPTSPITPVTPVPTSKKPVVPVKTPKSSMKPVPKSAPVINSTPSSSVSEESTDDDDEEGDSDDDDDEEEVARPAPKKARTSSTRDKKPGK